MAYATITELGNWLRTAPPADSAVKLDRASRLVARALVGASYPTDEDGEPTDAKHLAALRDATCAQVEAWIEAGYTPGAAPAPAEPKSVSIGSVTITNNGGPTPNPGAAAVSRDKLVTAAVDELLRGGLLTIVPIVYG